MPRKYVTWIGSFVILAAGGFCLWTLLQYKSKMVVAGAQSSFVNAAIYFVPALAIVAIFLWYYFNERA